MKKNIKTIWKSLMRLMLRVYANNFGLYIDNNMSHLVNEKFYSQFGQDVFVLKNVFKNKQEGVFVDVGGNHPVNGSNTYLLEQNGWQGLAVEPQESLRNLWPSIRKTPCLNYVIGPENKEVSFIEASSTEHGLSGVEGFNKAKKDYKKIEVQQVRLDTLLSLYSMSNIDYLSIDVEGYEMKVLEGIDFEKANIRLIGVENDIGFTWMPFIGKKLGSELGNNKLRNFIKSKGYTYVARIMCDDFFLKI